MITFLLNFTTEKITDTVGKLFLYPYLKKQKLRVIDGYNQEYEDVLSEIKHYIHNSSNIKNIKKEFQIFILLSVYNDKDKYFCGNLTNTIDEINEKLIDRLSAENLKAESLSYLLLDYFERDFRGVPYNINVAISEELNVHGYVESPVITFDEINSLDAKFKAIVTNSDYSDKDIFSNMEEEIESYFSYKKQKIDDSDVGNIDDAPIKRHLQKYLQIKENILDSLRYDYSKNKIREIEFDNLFNSILKANDYFYNYLFTNNDLEKIQKIFDDNHIVMMGEEKFNLSDKFIEKIKSLRNDLDKGLTEIIEEKKSVLESLEKAREERAALLNLSNEKIDKNRYIDKNILKEFEKDIRDRYLNEYLENIIQSKKLETSSLFLPIDKFKAALKNLYSLKNILNKINTNVYRIPFQRDNNSKYTENVLNYIFFMMFLMEYGEKREQFLDRGRFIELQGIKYRPNYLKALFRKYSNVLMQTQSDIGIKQDQLKKTAVIRYYKEKDNDKINNYKVERINDRVEICSLPPIELFYDTETIKKYKNNWLKFIDKEIESYIDTAEEGLSGYQNSKNEFVIASRHSSNINQNIESEVKELIDTLQNCREELVKIEDSVKLDIKNEWKKRNKEYAPLAKIEKTLNRRMTKKDFYMSFFIISLLAGISTFTAMTNIDSSMLLGSEVAGIVAFLMAVICYGVLYFYALRPKGKAKELYDESKLIRDKYLDELGNIFNTKKSYIDKQIACRIAEKNLALAKKEEKKINEKIEILGSYSEYIQNHCQIIETISNTLNNLERFEETEIEYENEDFNGKLKELDSEKAPFENDIFNLSKYIEIQEYRKFTVKDNNIQESLMNPENIFGCEVINIREDQVYKKVEEI